MCLDQVGFKTFLPGGVHPCGEKTPLWWHCVFEDKISRMLDDIKSSEKSQTRKRELSKTQSRHTHTHTHTYQPIKRLSCHVMSCHVAPADLWASCSTTNKGPAPSSSQISSTSAGKSYRRLPENQWSFQAPGEHVEEVPWDNSPYTATEVWTSLEKNMWIKGLLQLQHWIMLYAAHNT